MSVLAVGFLGVSLAPAIDVDLMGNRLKMFRIDAAAVSTEMVKVETFWNRTHQEFVHHPVGWP
jgi:hypothetical protein